MGFLWGSLLFTVGGFFKDGLSFLHKALQFRNSWNLRKDSQLGDCFFALPSFCNGTPNSFGQNVPAKRSENGLLGENIPVERSLSGRFDPRIFVEIYGSEEFSGPWCPLAFQHDKDNRSLEGSPGATWP